MLYPRFIHDCVLLACGFSDCFFKGLLWRYSVTFPTFITKNPYQNLFTTLQKVWLTFMSILFLFEWTDKPARLDYDMLKRKFI
jgi:hypothetical protein